MSKINVTLTVDLPEVQCNHNKCVLDIANSNNDIKCNLKGCKFCFFDEDNYRAIWAAYNEKEY